MATDDRTGGRERPPEKAADRESEPSAQRVVDAVDETTVWVDTEAVDPNLVGLDVDVEVGLHETEDIETLDGVTEERAERLHEAGYESVTDLRRAEADEVGDVENVSRGLAGRLTTPDDDFEPVEFQNVSITHGGTEIASFEKWTDEQVFVDASSGVERADEWTAEHEVDEAGDVHLGVSFGTFRRAVPAEEVIVAEAHYDDHGKVVIPDGDGEPELVDEGIGSDDEPPAIDPEGDKIVTVRYADDLDAFDTRVDRPTATGIERVETERETERDEPEGEETDHDGRAR